MSDPIDFRKERLKRSDDALSWSVKDCIENLHERLTSSAPDYLKEADAVVIVFTKRYPDGSSAETVIQASTASGNEAIGILTCGIALLTRPE
jgi:hypothetical protein